MAFSQHTASAADGVLSTCVQVLSASVVDMLQAGIHQQEAATGKAAAAIEGPAPTIPDPASQLATAATQPEPEPEPESESAVADSEEASQPARACIFEVEVVLAMTGTKITPSVSQFLVCHHASGAYHHTQNLCGRLQPHHWWLLLPRGCVSLPVQEYCMSLFHHWLHCIGYGVQNCKWKKWQHDH